jgi:hypothetical protein
VIQANGIVTSVGVGSVTPVELSPYQIAAVTIAGAGADTSVGVIQANSLVTINAVGATTVVIATKSSGVSTLGGIGSSGTAAELFAQGVSVSAGAATTTAQGIHTPAGGVAFGGTGAATATGSTISLASTTVSGASTALESAAVIAGAAVLSPATGSVLVVEEGLLVALAGISATSSVTADANIYSLVNQDAAEIGGIGSVAVAEIQGFIGISEMDAVGSMIIGGTQVRSLPVPFAPASINRTLRVKVLPPPRVIRDGSRTLYPGRRRA